MINEFLVLHRDMIDNNQLCYFVIIIISIKSATSVALNVIMLSKSVLALAMKKPGSHQQYELI